LQAGERIAVGERSRIDLGFGVGAAPRAVVNRRFGHQRLYRDVGRDFALDP
jgi:hypothetical protein